MRGATVFFRNYIDEGQFADLIIIKNILFDVCRLTVVDTYFIFGGNENNK